MIVYTHTSMLIINPLKIPRALRTCFRAVWSAARGPERGKEKMMRVLTALSRDYIDAEPNPDDLGQRVRVYFHNRAWRCVRRAILSAKKTIHIQMFIWKDDTVGRDMAQLLVDAGNRGVEILIHKEMIGDIFEFADDFGATQGNARGVWKSLWNHPNITVHHDNRHDHSKVYIIDNNLILIASMNIGDAYCNEWHECLVELRGKHFVHEYINGGAKEIHLKQQGQVQIFRSSVHHPMRSAVINLLSKAKKSIRIEVAYFADPEIIKLLAKKTREGVFVFIILPHAPQLHHHANMVAAPTLLNTARKRRAFIFRFPRKLLHTKMILVDRKTLFIGSTNLMTSSLNTMSETNVLIHKRPRRCLRRVRRRFTKDMIQSVSLKAEERTRVWWHRVLSMFNL
jgi:cardiolipin synthase